MLTYKVRYKADLILWAVHSTGSEPNISAYARGDSDARKLRIAMRADAGVVRGAVGAGMLPMMVSLASLPAPYDLRTEML